MFGRQLKGLVILIFYGVLAISRGAEVSHRVLPGHVPSVVAHLATKGLVPATNQLSLAIGLPLRHQAELGDLIRQLYDPASTNYHQFLTPAEFTDRFGPTEQDYQSVVAFAQAGGLNISEKHGDRMLLDVIGSAANVERTFQIKLRTYRHPSEARDFFAPDTEPTVTAALPVVDIQGLSDYSRPHPLIQPQPLSPQSRLVRPNSGSAPGGGGQYFGSDFRAAYAPGTALNGSNQTVGLVQFDGFYSNDIVAYENQAGLPNVPLQTVLLDSFSGTPTANGNPEVSLDMEMVIAMAPGISKLIVYEGNPANFIPNDVLSRIASDNLAKQISSSWSWNGGPSTTTDGYLVKMIAQGQSYFTASGDSDAYTGANTIDTTSSFTTPITSSNVTAVGGTTLSTGPGGAYTGETVWNWNNSGHPNVGSSGGLSTYYNIPYWQTTATTVGNNRSTTKRNIPDVALTADNIYVIYGNGSAGIFGGTSCAAPLWAGFTALVNQQAALAGLSSVGFLNPALYALGTNANYAALFHDTTTGSNIGTNTPGLYNAVAGYDLCTGLGSPNGTNLINALAPPAKPFLITQPTSQNVTIGVNVVFSTTAGGAAPLFYQWQFNGVNLADGGNIVGSASNVLSLAAVTVGNAGNYSLIVSNNYGAVTSSVVVLNVGSAPAFSTQPTSLTVFGGSNAVLSTTVTGSASLAYQWRKNGTNLSNSSGISGANSNVLTLTAVTINSAGNYNLYVTNGYGAAVSSMATLTVILPASLTNAGWTLLAESATPTNGAIDPGETVSVNFTLQNQGTVATTNLVATFQANTGVLAPSGQQTYGVVAGNGGSTSRPFTFTAAGTCGSNIVATLQLQDGSANLGTVSFALPLGGFLTNLTQSLTQNFDGVAVPALPLGWTTTNITGTGNAWATTAATLDTAPNSIFVADIASTSESALVSPVISIFSSNAQLSFRHNFSFDFHSTSSHIYRDGGVLEIKIGNAAFTDILTAGGSFVAGGYNNTINTANGNPLNGRSAWVGVYNFWQTVTVNLPASAAGQNIQLRWNCATDSSNSTSSGGGGAVGWYVDTISITDGVATPNCVPVIADLAVNQTLASISLQTGQNLVYTLAVTNLGPQSAANVIVTDAVPANVTLISASPGYTYTAGQLVWPVGILQANASTNLTVTLTPVAANVFTNLLSAVTVTPEFSTANISSTLISTQTVSVPASIGVGPVSQSIQCGSNGIFSVAVSGTAPLSLQWSLDSVPVTAATNTVFLLTNVHATHLVTVSITNLYGSATSNAVVTVFDTLPPVITLNGGSRLTNELGSAFTDPGATATDLCAGIVAVTTNGTVNIAVVSTNNVTYLATDGSGNTNTVTRTVVVRDTTSPAISWSFTNLTLVANSNCIALLTNVTGTNFILAADLSGPVTITQNPTNNAPLPLGTNIVVLTVADASGNRAYSTNTVLVRDQTPPVITLNGSNLMTNELGTAFVDLGVVVSDTCSGIALLTTNGMVNVNAIGTNFVNYIAVDGSGNTNTAIRTVVVRDTTPPAILWAFTNLVLAANSNCVGVMPNLTGTNFILASDLSGALTMTQIPTNTAILFLGTNVVVITVKDASGNPAYSTNQIIVLDQTPPVVLSQPQSLTNSAGTTAIFSMLTTACTPQTYQWSFNSSILTGQTNSTLTLSNVTPAVAGNYAVVASASGGATTSAVVSLTVNLYATTLALISSSNPAGFKGNVTFTATVMPTNATGSIQYFTNNSSFDSELLAGGQAVSTNLASLPRGTNLITAVYFGDVNDLPATNVLLQVVTNHPPSANPAFYTRGAGTVLNLATADLSTNWSDVDGDTVSLAAVAVSTNGVTVTNNAGTLVYFNPNNVPDQFACTLVDGFGGTNFQAIVTLAVAYPAITAVAVNPNGSIDMNLKAAPGYTYVLEARTNLFSAGIWRPIATNTLGTNGVWPFTDTISFPQQFYRLRLAP